MPIKTWLDRLTNESNLWLNATRSEDEGNKVQAAIYYLRDACESIGEGSLVKAGLSCSCAANCLAQAGDMSYGYDLFKEAGNLYHENADLSTSRSIREALWSLQEAYENYSVIDDQDKLRIVSDKYITLAGKISPFADSTIIIKTRLSKNTKEYPILSNTNKIQDPELASVYNQFLKLRSEKRGNNFTDTKEISSKISLSGGSRINEKSIIS